MKNSVHSTMSFITHVLAKKMNLVSNDRNVLKLLKDKAKNLYFVFEDFITYLTAR